MSHPASAPNPPRPTDGAAPGSDAFQQTLLRSQLLDRPRLDLLLANAPEPVRGSPHALADHLIAAGELTHYQAEKLLRGLWQGLVLGSFRILAPLGRGGMGTVYLAHDSRIASSVPGSALIALKILPPKRAREEAKTLARFRREMELGKVVAHPNIARTIETGEVGGVHYIALEFVAGQSLKQAVTSRGPLSLPVVARVFADVCAGLAHAHSRGLIHRDLKPANIMVTPSGRGKVLDLGLAILVGEALPADPSIVGGQGYILGTMDYIAPEQAENATDVSPKSDLYAAGCSLYFALTGAPPFPGGTSLQKMKWHRTGDAEPIRLLNPSVSPEAARLVERMMAKHPADRPDSAAEVERELHGWINAAAEEARRAEPTTVREVVAVVDARENAPTLWDADPLPLDDAPEPLSLPEDPARRQARLMLLGAGLFAAGLVVLIALLMLVRRL